jgi:hypothetical protein
MRENGIDILLSLKQEDSYGASLVLRSLFGGFLLHRDALQRILSTG